MEEVPEECEFVSQLKNIFSCFEEASFTDAVQKFPKRFDIGYSKATVTFEDKNDLLNACIKHIVLSIVPEEIYTFRKGLASFGGLDLLHKFPDDGLK